MGFSISDLNPASLLSNAVESLCDAVLPKNLEFVGDLVGLAADYESGNWMGGVQDVQDLVQDLPQQLAEISRAGASGGRGDDLKTPGLLEPMPPPSYGATTDPQTTTPPTVATANNAAPKSAPNTDTSPGRPVAPSVTSILDRLHLQMPHQGPRPMSAQTIAAPVLRGPPAPPTQTPSFSTASAPSTTSTSASTSQQTPSSSTASAPSTKATSTSPQTPSSSTASVPSTKATSTSPQTPSSSTASAPSTEATSTSQQTPSSSTASAPSTKATSTSQQTPSSSTVAAPSTVSASTTSPDSPATPGMSPDAFFRMSDTDLMNAVRDGKIPDAVKKDPDQMRRLQLRMNDITEMNQLITTMLKALHDMNSQVIQNLRV